MSRRSRAEKLFIGSAFILVLFGIVMLTNISIPLSQENFGESFYYFRHQLLYGLGAGIVLFFIARSIPPTVLKRLALPLFLVGLLFAALVHIQGLGFEAGGARRWLSVGSLTFQPSEILKLALVVYLAAWLDRHRARSRRTSALSFLLIVGLAATLVALQRDLGTTVLIAGTALVMYFTSGVRLKTLALALCTLVLAAGTLIAIEPYRQERFLSFLGISPDESGRDYQLNQALIAIGSGGFWGKGFGQSIQKYHYLPEAMTDSVFAIIAEEIGFIGTFVVLGLFLVFIYSGIRTAQMAQTNFGTFFTIGIVSWIGIQTLMNIGGISKILPFTGIPLPFISYGGTAIAIELAAVGLVSSIARKG